MRVDSPFIRIWNQGEYGDVVVWDWYATHTGRPYYWGIYDASLKLDQFWESENYPDDDVDRGTAPIIFDSPHDRIPPDGGSIRAYLPSLADLQTIETEAQAASIPAWVTGTKYVQYPNTELLLNGLFVDKQRKRGRGVYADLTDVSTAYMTSVDFDLYYTLWLRSASQVLRSHIAETMVPLVRNRMKISADTGVLTLQ